jgi:hypothetical protein
MSTAGNLALAAGLHAARIARLVALIAVGATCWPLAGVAQVTTAVLQGHVLDDAGAPLPGATVTARNATLVVTRAAIADSSGAYRIAGLPIGAYEVAAATGGYATAMHRGLTLAVGQEARLDFELSPAAYAETLTVEAEPPIVETTKTALGRTLTAREIDDLAVSGRNFATLALLTAGILDGTGPSNDNTSVVVTASGGNGANNTFLIDGLSNDQDTAKSTRGQLALDAIAEFQVLSASFSAEFGQASGAVINVVTRSGGNDVHGRAYAYYRADRLAANDPFVQADPATGRKEQAPFSQTVVGGFLGGPLRKDRTFFFAAYDHTVRDDTAVVTVDRSVLAALGQDPRTNYPHQRRNPLALVKIDHHPADNRTLTLRYRLDHAAERNANFGGKVTREAGLDTTVTNQDAALFDTRVVSPTAINDMRLQGARQARDSDADRYCPHCPLVLRPSVTTGKSSNQPQRLTEDRLQLADSFAWSRQGRGDHAFTAGVDTSLLEIRGRVPQNFDGLFLFTTDRPFDAADASTYPAVYQVSTGDPSFDVHNEVYGLFVQDQWRVTPALTLEPGIRWDYEDHVAVRRDKDNLAPRIHFAWDPWKRGTAVVRGGFGTYYDQVFLNVPLLSVLLNGSLRTTTILSPGYPDPFVGSHGVPIPSPPPTVATFQRGLETPYKNVVSLGFQRELTTDMVLGVDAVYARGHHLLVLIDENYSVDGSPRPDPRFSQVLTVESRARSRYQALQLALDKRFSHRYGFSLAYTLADTERDTEGHQFAPVDSRRPGAELGPANNDARHTLAGSANLDAPWGVKLGVSGRYRSALPYTIRTGTDDNRDLINNDRPPGVSRNSVRGSAAWTVDLRVARVFGIGRTTLEVVVEAFNLFNHPNKGFYEGNRLSPSFGRPTQTLDNLRPRQVQLGFRLEL